MRPKIYLQHRGVTGSTPPSNYPSPPKRIRNPYLERTGAYRRLILRLFTRTFIYLALPYAPGGLSGPSEVLIRIRRNETSPQPNLALGKRELAHTHSPETNTEHVHKHAASSPMMNGYSEMRRASILDQK